MCAKHVSAHPLEAGWSLQGGGPKVTATRQPGLLGFVGTHFAFSLCLLKFLWTVPSVGPTISSGNLTGGSATPAKASPSVSAWGGSQGAEVPRCWQRCPYGAGGGLAGRQTSPVMGKRSWSLETRVSGEGPRRSNLETQVRRWP